MHHSFRCQSKSVAELLPRAFTRFCLLKEATVRENVDCSITSGIETVFRNFEDVLRLRNLIASRFFLLKLSPFGRRLV